MRSLSTNSSKRPFPPCPRSVATATRISRLAARPERRKPQVTPSASWGTGNGRTPMAPTANSCASKVQTGPDRADRERIRRGNGRTLSSCRRSGPPCSTSMRLPELPLRSGRTANPLLKGQKLQPGSFVRGSRGADAQNLEDHRFDHDERLAFLPDAPRQEEPSRNHPFPFPPACEPRPYLLPVVEPCEHDPADRSRLIPHRAPWGSRGVPGEDEVVPLHIRLVAREAGARRRLLRRVPAHEPR